ncbi:50S ribosomal protein L5 [Candidatus Woesebacteria bacterium]|nr:50S ribosomal protein L5 [Candidatus Woesebacteria bacterium]
MQITKQYFETELVPQLMKELKISNTFAVPRLKKITLNVGVTDPQDPRARKPIIENVVAQLATISGQKPQITRASKSISGFKLRQGDPVGVMVTLRGDLMWVFLQKLITVALPRVKDFRGVSLTAFDGHGNFSLGLDEQIIFPEINYDTIDRIRSLQVVMVTSTDSDEGARVLLRLLGMPFAKEEKHG